MEVAFKIEKITNSNGGKTAVLTLSVGITLFGIEGAKRNVYYIGGISADSAKTLKLGQELKDNLENYWQVKRPFTHPTSGKEILLTWLHSKVQYPDGPPKDVVAAPATVAA